MIYFFIILALISAIWVGNSIYKIVQHYRNRGKKPKLPDESRKKIKKRFESRY